MKAETGIDGLVQAAKAAGYEKVGNGHFVKWNPLLGIKSTLLIEPSGIAGKVNVTTRREQYVGDILDLNVKQQNDFSGYKGKELFQGSRIPIVQHQRIMEKCGFKPGQGYDEKKFRQILNDRDFYKLKTVPGKL